MCGIAAVIDPRGAPGAAVAGRLASALSHRGPDGDGVLRDGPALLIHTRLSIVDLAGGAQPLRSETGSCAAIVNGEIYNHRDLRARLEARGHRFATRSDSEVVVHAYEEFGPRCAEHLEGIFAFVLWDSRRRRLVAARDPFGVKPLYWCWDGRRFAAASEAGALLAAGLVRPELDRVALDHVLAWRFVPAPRTQFAGVSKLPPASVLVAEDGRVEVTSYRRPPGEPLRGVPEHELAGALRSELEAAVRRQLMADVPCGAFLSGGVDSAAVVASMVRAGAQPATFTVGFPEQSSRDEAAAAAQTARALGVRNAMTPLRQADYEAALPTAMRHLEEPCGSQSAPALLALSRLAARDVKVVLSGQGADEPLGGYKRAQAAAALAWLDRVPRGLAGAAVAAAGALPRSERAKRAARLLETAPGRERLLRIFDIAPAGLRTELTGGAGEQAAAERAALAGALLADVAGRDPLEQALYLDTRLVLPDSLLLYGDKLSMAAGLEHRVPFLDLPLMRFVERLPAHLRVRRGVRKWLYRRAVRGLVPQAALDRPKQGFTTPYDRWLRGSLGAAVAGRYAAGGALGAVLDPAVVTRIVDAHQRGRDDHKRLLWCLLEVAEWHRVFVEEAPAEPLVAA